MCLSPVLNCVNDKIALLRELNGIKCGYQHEIKLKKLKLNNQLRKRITYEMRTVRRSVKVFFCLCIHVKLFVVVVIVVIVVFPIIQSN